MGRFTDEEDSVFIPDDDDRDADDDAALSAQDWSGMRDPDSEYDWEPEP